MRRARSILGRRLFHGVLLAVVLVGLLALDGLAGGTIVSRAFGSFRPGEPGQENATLAKPTSGPQPPLITPRPSVAGGQLGDAGVPAAGPSPTILAAAPPSPIVDQNAKALPPAPPPPATPLPAHGTVVGQAPAACDSAGGRAVVGPRPQCPLAEGATTGTVVLPSRPALGIPTK